MATPHGADAIVPGPVFGRMRVPIHAVVGKESLPREDI